MQKLTWPPVHNLNAHRRCMISQQASNAKLDILFVVSLNKLLNKHSSCHWFKLMWHYYNYAVTSLKFLNDFLWTFKLLVLYNQLGKILRSYISWDHSHMMCWCRYVLYIVSRFMKYTIIWNDLVLLSFDTSHADKKLKILNVTQVTT